MKVFIDETGDFKVGCPGSYGLMTLVTIPNPVCPPIVEFISKVQGDSPKPIKGTNIRFIDRLQLANAFQKSPEIKYTTIVFCGDLNTVEGFEWFKETQIDKIAQNISIPRSINNVSLTRDLELFLNQIRSLSVSDFLKFILLEQLIIKWQEVFLFDYENLNNSDETWEFEFILDSINKSQKMRRLITGFLYLTTNSGINSYKIFIPSCWRGCHPFVKKYEQENGINAKAIFSNLGFHKEEEQPLLALPAILGNTFYRALHSPDNIPLNGLIKTLNDNRSKSMTISGNNYFIVSGIDPSKTKRDYPFAVSRLHQNITLGIFDLLGTR